MKLYETAMLLLQLMANNDVATMALFTAYIDDNLGFELFCNDLPLDLFHMLRSSIAESQGLRDALKDTGIIEAGLKIYMNKAFEDCDTLYHLMDGELTILKNPIFAELLSNADRCRLESMFKGWREGVIDDDNWEDRLTEICEERNSK